LEIVSNMAALSVEYCFCLSWSISDLSKDNSMLSVFLGQCESVLLNCKDWADCLGAVLEPPVQFLLRDVESVAGERVRGSHETISDYGVPDVLQ